jgi:beta-ureidopropionase / N-carbamoyl-L-amino-acid hydrolase
MSAVWGNPLWQKLLPLGREESSGGYRRYTFTEADSRCRDWFFKAAEERFLRVECDAVGNLWGWWLVSEKPVLGAGGGTTVAPAAGATPSATIMPSPEVRQARGVEGSEVIGGVVAGSHLDSVPDGGAFDGPLGVVSAFLAIDRLRERGFQPVRPIGVAAFIEEEGARFGSACLGSKLLTGVVEADVARGLVDAQGVTFAEAMRGAGLDPEGVSSETGLVGRVSAFVELHVEQGSALDGMGAAVGVGESIWPHGRWRIEFSGRADHAGTTELKDRRDPMLPFAATVLAARDAAVEFGGRATMSKVVPVPGGANGICSAVHAWLDARAADEQTLDRLVGRVMETAGREGDRHGVEVKSRRESFSLKVEFDLDLRDRVVTALANRGVAAPVLPTGAGHDAGVLAAVLPTAMLFVRNRTGVSHSPAEHAEPADCEAGVDALAVVLEELASR